MLPVSGKVDEKILKSFGINVLHAVGNGGVALGANFIYEYRLLS